MITILNHIDVFIFYKYGSKISPLWNNDTLSAALTRYFYQEIKPKDLDSIFWGIAKPKDGQTIEGLRNMGFQPKTIAEWLDINQSTVSYHLNKPNKQKYMNIHLDRIQRKINNILHNYDEEMR